MIDVLSKSDLKRTRFVDADNDGGERFPQAAIERAGGAATAMQLSVLTIDVAHTHPVRGL